MTARSIPTARVEQNISGAPVAGTESVGGYLSRQRRLRGISLEELAELTKIPLRSLERLESGQFDGTADGFVRGFVRTVADGLGLDVDDTLTRMLSEVQIEDRHTGRPGPAARRWIAVAVVAVSVALTLTVVAAIWQAATSGDDRPADTRAYWRDPVRALADAAGAVPAEIATRPSSDPAAQPNLPRAVARGPEARSRSFDE